MLKTAFGSPAASKTRTKAWEGLFVGHPTLYIGAIIIAALVAFAYQLRTQSIFSCFADGYSADRYLAYCNGGNYADYEHGAFYFDLEPSALDFARNAEVLFLGNSRFQIGLSTTATTDWFAKAAVRYYLMGFSYMQNVVFTEKLLQKIQPRAKVYVIDVDKFFVRSESAPVRAILHNPESRKRYETKQALQPIHRRICQSVPAICGHNFVIFRSRKTGAYFTEGAFQNKIIPISYDDKVNKDAVVAQTAVAKEFLSQFGRGKCVIFTMVPFVGTDIGNANAIARALGIKLVTPEIADGLRTFDGYHLDPPSAQRWSTAFFEAAGPAIRSCLEKEGISHR
jgi:hypothetical protein